MKITFDAMWVESAECLFLPSVAYQDSSSVPDSPYMQSVRLRWLKLILGIWWFR